MRSLLDVNVLLSLLDRRHLGHGAARAFLDAESPHGWASCPITENGFIRVVTQPRYPNPVPVALALERLSRACATGMHEFWPCDASILDPAAVDRARLHGHGQVTDAYLLALAVLHGGRLVTFDRSVPLSVVPGAAPEHLVVL